MNKQASKEEQPKQKNDRKAKQSRAREARQELQEHEALKAPARGLLPGAADPLRPTSAIHRTKILDFRGFDPSSILRLRGGILMSMGNFQEILSQRILV